MMYTHEHLSVYSLNSTIKRPGKKYGGSVGEPRKSPEIFKNSSSRRGGQDPSDHPLIHAPCMEMLIRTYNADDDKVEEHSEAAQYNKG